MVKERGLIENAVFEDDMADLAEDVTFENAALSKIPRHSDKPVLNQEGIKDDAKAELVKEASNKLASSPGNSRFVGIGEKESTKKLAQRMKKFLDPSNLSSARQIWLLRKKFPRPLKAKHRATWRSSRYPSATIVGRT